MQIVIDIDEDTYRYMQSRCKYQNKGDKGLSKFEIAGVAIKNGILLPKGHGRLVDADKVLKAMDTWDKFDPCDLCAYNSPSSTDGKPCSMCPAVGKEVQNDKRKSIDYSIKDS